VLTPQNYHWYAYLLSKRVARQVWTAGNELNGVRHSDGNYASDLWTKAAANKMWKSRSRDLNPRPMDRRASELATTQKHLLNASWHWCNWQLHVVFHDWHRIDWHDQQQNEWSADHMFMPRLEYDIQQYSDCYKPIVKERATSERNRGLTHLFQQSFPPESVCTFTSSVLWFIRPGLTSHFHFTIIVTV